MNHIEVSYHQIRDWVYSEEIKVEKVHTNKNAADFLTKPVKVEKFKHCLSLLNLRAYLLTSAPSHQRWAEMS